MFAIRDYKGVDQLYKILMTDISTTAVLYSGLENFCTMTSQISFQNILSTMFILRRILTTQMWTNMRRLSPALWIMMSPMYSGTYKILWAFKQSFLQRNVLAANLSCNCSIHGDQRGLVYIFPAVISDRVYMSPTVRSILPWWYLSSETWGDASSKRTLALDNGQWLTLSWPTHSPKNNVYV
mgnify:CR=1 FL=1